MNLYFNTDSLNFVNSPTDFSPVSSVSFIFGSSQNIGVTLVNAGNNGAFILSSGYNMVLGLKPVGTYLTGNYLAYGSTNLVPNTGVGNYSYGITGFNLYSTGISGLLAENNSISLAMELEYDNNGSGVVLSNPITCSIYNSYINLNQVPFITGALAVYPAPNNIQTVTNLGITYVGSNQTGLFQPSGHYLTTAESGLFYPMGTNPSAYLTPSETGSLLALGNDGMLDSSLNVSGTLGSLHSIGLSPLPSLTTGVGAGTSPSISIAGTDTEGIINVTAGTTPSANNAICTVTFSNSYSYPTTCIALIAPANAITAKLYGASQPYVTAFNNGFSLTSNASGLSGSTSYSFIYHVRGY